MLSPRFIEGTKIQRDRAIRPRSQSLSGQNQDSRPRLSVCLSAFVLKTGPATPASKRVGTQILGPCRDLLSQNRPDGSFALRRLSGRGLRPPGGNSPEATGWASGDCYLGHGSGYLQGAWEHSEPQIGTSRRGHRDGLCRSSRQPYSRKDALLSS